jgi:hypothetical protein
MNTIILLPVWQNRAENLFEINVLLSNLEQSDKPNPLGRTEIDPLNRVKS